MINSYVPKPHEETFKVEPVGVKYICELCNKGEMILDTNSPARMSNPPLYSHKCTNCGGEMLLPKVYPYIEWIKSNEGDNINGTT